MGPTPVAPIQTSGPDSFGINRVKVVYKDTEESTIEEIRQKLAEFINLLKEHELNSSGETARLYATAYTEIENACMWGIKAVTK